MSLSGATFDTELGFGRDRDFDVEMNTVAFSVARSVGERHTVRLVVGAILDGTLRGAAATEYEVEPGGLAAVGLEYRAKTGQGAAPSIDLSGSFGASWTQTGLAGSESKTDYFATDLRLGATFGWSLREDTYSYVVTRVFGGPVQWELNGEDVTGTDAHHYQLGMGSAAQLGRVGIFAEWVGLGEQAISVGMSTTW